MQKDRYTATLRIRAVQGSFLSDYSCHIVDWNVKSRFERPTGLGKVHRQVG